MVRKIALVGVGKIARDQHVPAIAASPDWELAATYSHEGEVEGVDSHTDFDALLHENPEIEAVSFCLPPAPRYDYAAQAIKAGRHVMLEKPPGATVMECLALEQMAREAGVSLYATWHSREAAQVAATKTWLLGKRLRALRIIWKEDVRRWHPGQDWIWRPAGLGVFDPTINAFSIVTEILPDPVHIVSGELDIPENCDMPIAGKLRLAHPHGAEVTADLDFLKEGEQFWTIEIETDGGSAVLSEGGAKLAIDGVEQRNSEALRATKDGSNPLLGGEYVRLYAKMEELVRSRNFDFDLSPMILTADAFLLSKRRSVAPFHE